MQGTKPSPGPQDTRKHATGQPRPKRTASSASEFAQNGNAPLPVTCLDQKSAQCHPERRPHAVSFALGVSTSFCCNQRFFQGIGASFQLPYRMGATHVSFSSTSTYPTAQSAQDGDCVASPCFLVAAPLFSVKAVCRFGSRKVNLVYRRKSRAN